MEIIKITKERVDQILPQNIKETDALSNNAKKVLATIINYHLVNEKVKATKFLAINNENLRESAGIGKAYLLTSIQELIECKLITRKAGHKWKEGEQKTASEYRLIVENLKKPIRKPTSDELLDMLFSTPSEPLSTKDSPTNTTTNTDTITNTLLNYSNTTSISDSISTTTSKSVSDTFEYIEENNSIFENKKEFEKNCKPSSENVEYATVPSEEDLGHYLRRMGRM